MGFSDINRSQMEGAATPDSLSALVTQIQAELHWLMARREALVRRIRSLHQVMRGLREIASPAAFDHLCADLSSPTGYEAVGEPFLDNRTPAVRSGRHQRSGDRCQSSCGSLGLERACRIALMEADAAASLEEIYARIVRRGSFSFANFDGANPALVRVLSVMAEYGEIRLWKGGPCRRWERIA